MLRGPLPLTEKRASHNLKPVSFPSQREKHAVVGGGEGLRKLTRHMHCHQLSKPKRKARCRRWWRGVEEIGKALTLSYLLTMITRQLQLVTSTPQ